MVDKNATSLAAGKAYAERTSATIRSGGGGGGGGGVGSSRSMIEHKDAAPQLVDTNYTRRWNRRVVVAVVG